MSARCRFRERVNGRCPRPNADRRCVRGQRAGTTPVRRATVVFIHAGGHARISSEDSMRYAATSEHQALHGFDLRAHFGLAEDVGIEVGGTQGVFGKGARQRKAFGPACSEQHARSHLRAHADLGAGVRCLVERAAGIGSGLRSIARAVARKAIPSQACGYLKQRMNRCIQLTESGQAVELRHAVADRRIPTTQRCSVRQKYS